MDQPTTRYSLLVRLRDRSDEAAWSEFVTLYEPLVYRLARRKGLQDADARDVCQDVLRAVAGAIERWDPDPAKGSFRGWLYRIARNLMINFLASERRRPKGSGDTGVNELLAAQPSLDSAASAIFDEEYKRRVFEWAAERVATEVTDSTWQAFWKTGVENRPVAEVAAELGISAGAVYIARSRVLARLRQRIEEIEDGSSHGNAL